jgi:hypothetical protein
MQMQGSYIYITERIHIVYNPYKILSLPVTVTVIMLCGIAVVVVMPHGVTVALLCCIVLWSWLSHHVWCRSHGHCIVVVMMGVVVLCGVTVAVVALHGVVVAVVTLHVVSLWCCGWVRCHHTAWCCSDYHCTV